MLKNTVDLNHHRATTKCTQDDNSIKSSNARFMQLRQYNVKVQSSWMTTHLSTSLPIFYVTFFQLCATQALRIPVTVFVGSIISFASQNKKKMYIFSSGEFARPDFCTCTRSIDDHACHRTAMHTLRQCHNYKLSTHADEGDQIVFPPNLRSKRGE